MAQDKKEFSQADFDKYDVASRKILIDALRSSGFSVKDGNEVDRYGVDLLITYGADIEVRPDWHGPSFPFPTIHVPYRKRKFIEAMAFKYFVMNSDLSYALVTSGGDIIRSSVVEIDTKCGTVGEKFFDVPRDMFVLFKIGNHISRN